MVFVFLDLNVPAFAPGGPEGVFHDPALLAVADDQSGVVSLGPAQIEDALLVVLPLRGVESRNNGLLSDEAFELVCGPVSVRGVRLDEVLVCLRVFASSLLARVGVHGLLAQALLGRVFEGVQDVAAVASLVALVFRAVDELLLREEQRRVQGNQAEGFLAFIAENLPLRLPRKMRRRLGSFLGFLPVIPSPLLFNRNSQAPGRADGSLGGCFRAGPSGISAG